MIENAYITLTANQFAVINLINQTISVILNITLYRKSFRISSLI